MKQISESLIAALNNEGKAINEAVENQHNHRPEGATEWTFADYFGADLTGQTYKGNISFYMHRQITSLKGAPEVVDGDFTAVKQDLTSLEGMPKVVSGILDVSDNKLTSLEGCPQKLSSFYCTGNKLTSLKGGPKIVRGSYNCSGNELTSLEGAPEKVEYFNCSNNNLASLEGGPKEAKRYNCTGNQLESLDGLPEGIKPDNVFADSKVKKDYFGAQKIALGTLKRLHSLMEEVEIALDKAGHFEIAEKATEIKEALQKMIDG